MIMSPKPKSKFKIFKSQTLDTGFKFSKRDTTKSIVHFPSRNSGKIERNLENIIRYILSNKFQLLTRGGVGVRFVLYIYKLHVCLIKYT